MRACFCAIVRPGFAFLIGLLLCGVRVGVPVFVGTVVWFGRGEGVGPEGRFFVRVGAMVRVLFCADSTLRIFALVEVVVEEDVLETRLGVEVSWRSFSLVWLVDVNKLPRGARSQMLT